MTTLTKTTPPEALDAVGVARLLAVGDRTVRKLDKAGAIPSPILIDTVKRWRRRELIDWLAAGAPDRATWDHLGWEPSQYWTLERGVMHKRAELGKLQADIEDARRVLDDILDRTRATIDRARN